jgi:hypothetical protein
MAPEQARGEASRVGKATDVFGLGGILCEELTGLPPFTHLEQPLTGDVREAFARLDNCGADQELIDLAKACLAAEPEARPADAAEVAARLNLYRAEAAARQAEADRLLWLRAVGEAFPPAVEDARSRFRQQACELLRAEVALQAQRLSSGSPAEAAGGRQVLEAMGRLPVVAAFRNPEAMADLSEAERRMWQAFWQEVDRLLRDPIPPR